MELKFENSSTGAPPQVLQIPIRGKTIVYTAVAAATPTAEQLQDYRGDYYSPELEVVYRVSCDSEGRLYMRHRPEPPVRLNPVYADAFSTSDGGRIVRFTRNKRGKIDGLSVYAGRVRHLRFVRRS
jgi:hypothetical protein